MTATLYRDSDLDLPPIPAEILENYAGRFRRRPPAIPEPGVIYIGEYARLSQDKHGDDLGVERQFDYLIPLAEELGRDWGRKVVPVLYCDNDTSATSGETRHDFDRMSVDIAAKRLQTIAAWDTTRLFRDDMDRALFVKLAQNVELQPIWFHGKSRKDLNDYDGEFELAINGAVAVRHSRELRAKLKESFKQRARKGRAFWPRRPFGFEVPNRDGTGVVHRKAESDLIELAYRDVLRGRSVRSIAKEWTANGVRTPPTGGCTCEPPHELGKFIGCRKLKRACPDGNEWNGDSLRAMLLAPRNAGLRYYNGAIVGKADWEPIVDKEIWAGVVAKITARKNPSSYVRRWLLSGIAICGNCGARMHVNVPQPDKTGYTKAPRYTCGTGCMKMSRKVEDVHDVVMEDLVAFAEEQKLLRSQPTPVDTAALEGRLETLLDDEARTLRMRGVTEAVMQELLDEIHAEQAEASLALALAKVAPEENEDMAELIESLDEDEIRGKFDTLPLDRQRALINRVMSVVIHGTVCAEKHGHATQPTRPFNRDLVVTTRR